MPFICKRRTDIPNGVLQVSDLWPSKTQANAAIDPKPQGPRYVNAPVTNSVTLTSTGGADRRFPAAYTGLAAYLLANVQKAGSGGGALTPANADTIAAAIIAAMVAGSAQTLSAINTLLAATGGAGTELTNAGGSLSTGTVTDVLRILAGATYTVPSGTIIQTTGPVFNPQGSPATWNAANFNFNTFTDVLAMDSSFYISLAQGQLNGFTSTTFRYKGTTGAALVVYSDSGAVL
jgi:hypothetical protein